MFPDSPHADRPEGVRTEQDRPEHDQSWKR
jgi:hypothetical protein